MRGQPWCPLILLRERFLVLEPLLCDVGRCEATRAPSAEPRAQGPRAREAQARALRCGGWGTGEQGRILDLVQDLGLEILPVKTAHNRVQKCSGFPAAATLRRWLARPVHGRLPDSAPSSLLCLGRCTTRSRPFGVAEKDEYVHLSRLLLRHRLVSTINRIYCSTVA